jgi:hypothetical protein
VNVRRLDLFCVEQDIPRIDFLKLDVEGLELDVLRGAGHMLGSAIDSIQFEFGGTDIDSRVFLRDFFYLLAPAYDIFRIVHNGVVALPRYKEQFEIFMYANYLAVRRGTALRASL